MKMEYITARAQPTPKAKPRKKPISALQKPVTEPMMSCPGWAGRVSRSFGPGELAGGQGLKQAGREQDGESGEGEEEVEVHRLSIGQEWNEMSLELLCREVERSGV